MSKSGNHKMVRVPAQLHAELKQLAAEMTEAHERTNGRVRAELTDQGAKGAWVSIAEVIRVCKEDYVQHTERSRKRNAKRA